MTYLALEAFMIVILARDFTREGMFLLGGDTACMGVVLEFQAVHPTCKRSGRGSWDKVPASLIWITGNASRSTHVLRPLCGFRIYYEADGLISSNPSMPQWH